MKKIFLSILAALAFAGIRAADSTKVSELTATTSLDSADIFYVIDGGTSKKVLWYYMQQGGFPVDVRTYAPGNILFESFWLGEDAGLNNSSAQWNYGIGTRAHYSLTSGDGNTAFGLHAGYNLTSGSGNHFAGMYSGYSGTEGNYNVGLGYKPLYSLTSGSYNIAIGEALGTLTTAQKAVGIGYKAADSTNQNIVAIGSCAGQSSTGGSSVFVGENAGLWITGGGNTAIGKEALLGAYGSSGSGNSALGAYALNDISTGTNNVGIGYYAGSEMTTGSDGVFIGYQAGKKNTATGSIFIGSTCGDANTSGVNIAIGASALGTETTGSGNTVIGHQSATVANGITESTLLGYRAGYQLTTGDYNTLLGSQAGYSQTTTGGCVKIGYKAGYNDNTANKLFIDNSDDATPLIHGDFANDSLWFYGHTMTPNSYSHTIYATGVASETRLHWKYRQGGADTIFTAGSLRSGGKIYWRLNPSNTLTGYAIEVETDSTVNVSEDLNVGGYLSGATNDSLVIYGELTIRDDVDGNGAQFYADYSSGYTSRSATDKEYQDTHLGGKDLDATVYSPGAPQDGDVLTWDNDDSEFEMTDVVSVGSAAGLMVVDCDTVLYSNTSQTTTVTLPDGAVIWDIQVHVKTAFNGTGTDLLDIGTSGTGNRYEDDLDISGTGFKTLTLSNVPDRMTSSTNITFQYFDANSDASAGEAYVYVHYSVH